MPNINLTKVSDAALLAVVCFVPPALEEQEPHLPELAFQELNRRGLAHPIQNPLNRLSQTKFPPIFCLGSLDLDRLRPALDLLQDFYFGVD